MYTSRLSDGWDTLTDIPSWITNRLGQLLPADDDVTIGWCHNMLDDNIRFVRVLNR